MKQYCMPADFKLETLDAYDELNHTYKDSRLIETYGQITVGNSLGSGRSVDFLPEVDFIDLEKYVNYSRKKGIEFNYTLNASYLNNREFTEEGMCSIRNFLETLYQTGVRKLTVCLPSLIDLVKSMKCKFDIKASVICQITNANKALFYKELGVERIVADESLNKNFGELKKVRDAFGNGTEIIINSICYKDCTYRMFHYNQIAGDAVKITSNASTHYFSHRCILKRLGKMENILKLCWVRPEDIHYYTDIGIQHFKLQGRQLVKKGDPVRALECYFKESYDGDLMDLLYMFSPDNHFKIQLDNKKLDNFIKPFYELKNVCRNDCQNCRYCRNYAESCMDMEEAHSTLAMANAFFDECDEYSKMIKLLGDENGDAAEENLLPAEFDIE